MNVRCKCGGVYYRIKSEINDINTNKNQTMTFLCNGPCKGIRKQHKKETKNDLNLHHSNHDRPAL